MNPERTSHPSAAQVETLIECLESKPSLAKGFAKNQSAKQAANKEWERISLKLNSMGGGTIKTPKKWIKYWSDKKSAIKKKAAARAASRNATGGGMVDLPELSNLEERIILLMGGEGFATGDRHLQIQVFDEPSYESPSILAPVEQPSGYINMPEMEYVDEVASTPVIPVDQVITTADADLSLGHRIQSQLMDNILDSGTENAATATTTREMDHCLTPTQNVSQQDLPGADAGPVGTSPVLARPSTSGFSSPRRPRRRTLQAMRRNIQASPPSQRRSNLIGMADKFLRLEQQRLEMDRRVIALMERNSERDHLLVEATKAVGEGLKALADAIKR